MEYRGCKKIKIRRKKEEEIKIKDSIKKVKQGRKEGLFCFSFLSAPF